MERELLLLGVLRDQDMHGYQINELLAEMLGDSVQLKKATVYRLLTKLEERGLVSTYEEQEHNRPPRRVYAITEAGERQFEQMLRSSLSEYRGLDLIGAVDELFWDALPSRLAARLLRQRRAKAESMLLATYSRAPQGGRGEIAWRHHRHILRAELQWLDDLIAETTARAGLAGVSSRERPGQVEREPELASGTQAKPDVPEPSKPKRKPSPRSTWSPEFD